MNIPKILKTISIGLIILYIFGEIFVALYLNFSFINKYFYSGEDDEIAALYNDAAKFRSDDELEKALSIYEEIEIRSKKEFDINHPNYLRSLIFLSDMYFELGSYEFSQRYAETVMFKTSFLMQSEKGDVKIISSSDLFYLINILGKIYKHQGRYTDVEYYISYGYNLSQYRYEDASNPIRLNFLNNIGILYTDLYDYKKANFYLSQLEETCSNNNKNKGNCSAAFNSLGILNFQFEAYEKALGYFQKSLDLLDLKNTTKNITVNLHHNIALALLELNRLDEAEQELLISDSLSKMCNLSLSESVQLQNSFMDLYMDKGDFKSAENCLKQSLAIQESGGFKHTLDLAHTLAKASTLFQKEDNYEVSYHLIKEALKNVKLHFEENLKYTTQETRLQAIDILFKQQDILTSFLIDTDSMNNESQEIILKDVFKNTIYRKGLSFRTYAKQQAFLRTITDSIGLISLNEIRDKEDILQQAVFNNSISGMEQEKLKNEIETLKSMLYQSSFSSNRYNPLNNRFSTDETDLIKIQETLNEEDLYIEIIKFNLFKKEWTNDAYYIALIVDGNKDKSPSFAILGKAKTLEAQYFKTYYANIRKKEKDYRAFGHFLGSLSPYFKDKNTVYFSLDGIYHKISLRSLLQAPNQYFGDSLNIVRVASSQIPTHKEPSKKLNRIVLFGNPSFNLSKKGGWLSSILGKNASEESEIPSLVSEIKNTRNFRNGVGDLPYTKDEVLGIAKIFKDKWTVIELLEDKATKSNLKKISNPTVLHFATHGFFIKKAERDQSSAFLSAGTIDPMFSSGLLFAGASNTLAGRSNATDNGILSAFEVINLDLKDTDLVVLSACETGLGDIYNGEGVIGLQRAFQIAGAQNVMMSLWKVDDEATQQLMVLFYKNLADGQSKQIALKNAQISLRQIEKFNHPFYWAGFVLSSN